MPVELLTAFDWCWCHESLCRVLVRVWEFVGIFDHNNWIFFVVLYSCYLMGKMKSEANTLYELLLHFSMKNMRIVFNNIYSKKRAMRCFKMLFIIGVFGFFESIQIPFRIFDISLPQDQTRCVYFLCHKDMPLIYTLYQIYFWELLQGSIIRVDTHQALISRWIWGNFCWLLTFVVLESICKC